MAHAYTFRRKRNWHQAWQRAGQVLQHTSGLAFDVLAEPLKAHVQVGSLMDFLQRENDSGTPFEELGPAYERLASEAQIWIERNWHGRWDPRTRRAHVPSEIPA